MESLLLQVQKDAETGQILNLVLAWADKGTELKVDVPVVYKGEDECPGLQKGGVFCSLSKPHPPFSLLSCDIYVFSFVVRL